MGNAMLFLHVAGYLNNEMTIFPAIFCLVGHQDAILSHMPCAVRPASEVGALALCDELLMEPFVLA
jgi:hypothetical protein